MSPDPPQLAGLAKIPLSLANGKYRKANDDSKTLPFLSQPRGEDLRAEGIGVACHILAGSPWTTYPTSLTLGFCFYEY